MFIPVRSAPSNYSPNIALMLHYLFPDDTSSGEPDVAMVQRRLLDVLEDDKPFNKGISSIANFSSAIIKGVKEFQDPNKFQFCLTHIKHGLKGAALLQFSKNRTSAERDKVWADKYLSSPATMSILQYVHSTVIHI
jgi:hypothetical protein